MNSANDGRDKILSVTAMVLLSLTSLSWFSEGAYAVAGYDFATSLNPFDDMMRSLALWDERLYTGSPSLLSVGTFPYFLLQHSLSWLTGSLYRGHMVFFTMLLLMPGLTMYLFMRTIFPDHERKNDMALLTAVFYMLNTFVVIKWNRGELVTLFSYGLVPLYLALADRLVRGRPNVWLLAAFIASMFFYPVTIGHSADFLIITTFFIVFVAWRIAIGPRRLMMLRNTAIVGFCTLLAGAWWILPLFTGVAGGSAAISNFTTSDNLGLVNYYSSWASLLNIMKMWFFSMYPTSVEFNTQFYRPGTLIFPILGFSALLGARNRYVLFFSIAAILGLWFSKGTHAPLSWIYEWMYLNVPYFFIFRAPTRYFPIVYVLCLAVLVGFSTVAISMTISKWRPGARIFARVPLIAVLALVFFHAWPIFSRNTLFMTDKDDVLYPSVFLDVPGYYFELNDWFASRDGYFRVHSFSNRSYLNYTWGYSSTDIAPKLIEVPQTIKYDQELVFGSRGIHSLLDSLDASFWAWDFQGTDKVLGLLGARYVTVIDDVMRRYLPHTNYPEIVEGALSGMPGITRVKAVGPARVYENSFAAPHFSAATSARMVVGNEGVFSTLAGAGYLDGNPAFILDDGRGAGLSGGGGWPEGKGAIEELVFAGMNIYDAVCEHIDETYSFVPRPGASDFKAGTDGEHLVWVRDGEGHAAIHGLSQNPRYGERGAPSGIRWSYLGTWDTKESGHYISVDESGGGSFAIVPEAVWNDAVRTAEFRAASSGTPVTHLFRMRMPAGETEMPAPVSFYAPDSGDDRDAWGTGGGAAETRYSAVALPVYARTRVDGYSEDYAGKAGTEGWIFEGNDSGVRDDVVEIVLGPGTGLVRAGKKIVDSSTEDAGHGVDIEKYPYLGVGAESKPGYPLDVDAAIWLDLTGDGWADGEITTTVMRQGRMTTPVDLTDLLKEKFGYPGKREYRAVRLVYTVRRATGAVASSEERAELRLSSMSFFHEAPAYAGASRGGPLALAIDGDESAGPRLDLDESPVGAPEGRAWALAAGHHTLMVRTDVAPGAPADGTPPGAPIDFIVRVVSNARTGTGPGTRPPELEYTKVDSTKYLVTITPPAGSGRILSSFWLVFNEAFHQDWKATIEQHTGGGYAEAGLIKDPVSIMGGSTAELPVSATIGTHTMMNGYANGWWVELPAEGADRGFTVTVEFTPQRSLDTGILISLYSTTFIILYMPFYTIVLRRFFV